MRPRRRKYAPEDRKPPAGRLKPEERVNREDIELVAAAVMTPQDWFARYGRHYGIQSAKRVRILCASTLKTKRRSHCEVLPAGWQCVRNGYRLFIFLADKAARRTQNTDRLPPPPPPVQPSLVSRVFTVLFTAAEWLAAVGTPVYGFSEITYVDQMLRGRPWGNSKVPAELPPGWNSIRLGRSRFAYHDSLRPKAFWTEKRAGEKAL